MKPHFPDFNNDPSDTILDSYAEIFYSSIENNIVEVMDGVLSLTKVSVHERIIPANYETILAWTALNGHLSLIEKILELTSIPKEEEEMIDA